MDIVDALTGHHDTLRELFTKAMDNPELFAEFDRQLVIHHTMEEKYFYDFLEKVSEAEHDALEAVNEHHIIELIIKDAEGFPKEHERFPIKIEGLGEYTLHHLREEEEDIFPLARKLFKKEDLETLGNLFEKAKETLLSATPPDIPQSLTPLLK